MATTVADVMVATLRASGVRRVYGIPGDSLNGFTDALRRDGAIAWEHVRHEEAAGFAAAAEAGLTGELAVCAASCGPGNLHLINGLFDANRSGVPVLAIAAQIPAEEIGGEYFQETHPQELFRECSVYCELISTQEQLPRILQVAMRSALARGGVAVVVVPGEIFLAEVRDAGAPVPIRPTASVIRPDAASLAAAADVLNAAGRGYPGRRCERAGGVAAGRCRAGDAPAADLVHRPPDRDALYRGALSHRARRAPAGAGHGERGAGVRRLPARTRPGVSRARRAGTHGHRHGNRADRRLPGPGIVRIVRPAA